MTEKRRKHRILSSYSIDYHSLCYDTCGLETNQSQIIDISRIIHLAVFNYIRLHTIGNKRGTIGRPNEGLISSTSFSVGNVTVRYSKTIIEYYIVHN